MASARTFVRQDTQVRSSDVYDDTIVPSEAAFETNPVHIETDLNNIRSAHKNLKGTTNWWDTPTRDVETINTAVDGIENSVILCNASVLTNITVPGGQNWKILSVAGSEAPTENAAVGATTEGAVVAQSALSGAGFDVAEAALVVAGPDPLSPLNRLIIRDAVTKQPIQSSDRDVFGLLQYESTGVDGAAFNDTVSGNRVKITFVRINAGGTAYEVVPVADIAGRVIEYNYHFNRLFKNLDRNCFVSSRGFVDQTASIDVTRKNAYDNQGTTPVELANNADLDLGAGIEWAIRDALNADLFRIIEDSTGSGTTVQLHSDVDVFDVDALVNNFAQGVSTATGKTRPIDIGVTDGVIESTAGDLMVKAAAELLLDDVNQTGSTWAQDGIKLSETTQEWDDFETRFGEVSLLNAIIQADQNPAQRTKTQAVITANVSANNDVSGPSNDNNLDVDLHDLSTGNFVDDHEFYLNGLLLRNGADAAANNDIYPGTSLANGQVRFEFDVKGTGGNPDVLTAISYAV